MTAKGFQTEIKALSEDFKELSTYVVAADPVTKEAFMGFYCQLMFAVNQIFIFTVLFEDMERDREFRRKVSNLEDFYTMTVDPSLYKNYNHKRGKFALECCNKCKICRSSSVLADFPYQLQQARQELQSRRAFFRLLRLNVMKVLSFEDSLTLFKIILNCI